MGPPERQSPGAARALTSRHRKIAMDAGRQPRLQKKVGYVELHKKNVRERPVVPTGTQFWATEIEEALGRSD